MIGRYVLGSDTEAISFEPGAVVYRRAGATHAVDPADPANVHAASMGYALCGTPVRIWPGEPFDPRGRDAHEKCVALTGAGAPSGNRPIER